MLVAFTPRYANTIQYSITFSQTRLQDELAGSIATISSLECQAKVKADEWAAVENRLKEEKVQLQDQLTNLSRQLESSQGNQAHLQVSVNDANRELEEWKRNYGQLESKIRETVKLNLDHVITFEI